jgi:hypothetical protein
VEDEPALSEEEDEVDEEDVSPDVLEPSRSPDDERVAPPLPRDGLA